MTQNEVIAGKYCPLCSSTGEYFGEKNNCLIRVCSCKGLGLLSWQYKNIEDYKKLYETIYPSVSYREKSFIDRDEEFLEASMSRINFLNALIPQHYQKTLLDIGAGIGSFVSVANDNGYNSSGLELSDESVLYAQKNNRHVIKGCAENLFDKWDIITLHDVFEHLVYPIDFLQKARKHLKDQGILVIELPEFGCPQCLEKQLEWKHIRPLEHIWLPNKEMLEYAFELTEYRIVAMYRPKLGLLGKIAYYISPLN